MTAERWIIITRWEEYQHRDAARSKVLPWIKNETKLLSSPDYLDLTGHRRAILHGLWLEYARSIRRLPDDTATLSRRLGLRVLRTDLESLNHAGFIEFSASKPASNVRAYLLEEIENENEKVSKNPKSNRKNGRGAEFAIRTMIANGAIRDLVDLDAELQAAGLNGTTASALRALIEP